MEKNLVPESDPVLRQAAEEMLAIMKKYDIAGVCQLFSPGHNEYAMNLSPTWSVVKVNVKREIMVTAPLVDPNNEEAAKKKIMDTVFMLLNLRNCMSRLCFNLGQAEMYVRNHFEITPPPAAPDIPFKN